MIYFLLTRMYLAVGESLGVDSLWYVGIQELRLVPSSGSDIPFRTVIKVTEFRESVIWLGKKFTSLFSVAFIVGNKPQ